MPRMRRVVVTGLPHHVTQRGTRRQRTFFCKEDYQFYLALLEKYAKLYGLEIWAYCLMPNHVHLIAVPRKKDSLAKVLKQVHAEYSRMINEREGWKGHLWQERFASFPMDEEHLVAAVRYVLRNPVTAGLVEAAEDWAHSSTRAHIAGKDDLVVKIEFLRPFITNWGAFLAEPLDPVQTESFRKHSKAGLPLGSDDFIASLEAIEGRSLRPGKRGRPSAT